MWVFRPGYVIADLERRLFRIKGRKEKRKKFQRICYFELCFNQTLFRYDLSQKDIYLNTPANDFNQLEIEGYPTGLGKNLRAARVIIFYLLTL